MGMRLLWGLVGGVEEGVFFGEGARVLHVLVSSFDTKCDTLRYVCCRVWDFGLGLVCMICLYLLKVSCKPTCACYSR